MIYVGFIVMGDYFIRFTMNIQRDLFYKLLIHICWHKIKATKLQTCLQKIDI